MNGTFSCIFRCVAIVSLGTSRILNLLTQCAICGLILLGGFYSDKVGYVAKSCMKCPNGSFVSLNKAPGTRPEDCKACPQGKPCEHVISDST